MKVSIFSLDDFGAFFPDLRFFFHSLVLNFRGALQELNLNFSNLFENQFFLCGNGRFSSELQELRQKD